MTGTKLTPSPLYRKDNFALHWAECQVQEKDQTQRSEGSRWEMEYYLGQDRLFGSEVENTGRRSKVARGLGCSEKRLVLVVRCLAGPSRTILPVASIAPRLACPSPDLFDIPMCFSGCLNPAELDSALPPSCPLTFKNIMSLSRLTCFIEAQ